MCGTMSGNWVLSWRWTKGQTLGRGLIASCKVIPPLPSLSTVHWVTELQFTINWSSICSSWIFMESCDNSETARAGGISFGGIINNPNGLNFYTDERPFLGKGKSFKLFKLASININLHRQVLLYFVVIKCQKMQGWDLVWHATKSSKINLSLIIFDIFSMTKI